MNVERGVTPKIHSAGEKIQNFRKELKDWRLTTSLLMVIVGAGAVVDGPVQILGYNNTNAIENRVKQEIPSYSLEQYQAAQKTIRDFNANNEVSVAKGAQILEVPADVKQAVIYKAANKNGQELFKSKDFDARARFGLEFLGGFALAIMGFTEFLKRKIERVP